VDAGTETPRFVAPLFLPPAPAEEEEIVADATMPHLSMNTSYDGAPDCDPTDSNAFTTEYPSTTWPKTVCFPFKNGVATVHKKNCDPFVFGPAFAMDKIPGPLCGKSKFSSGKFRPYIDFPPVPLSFVKSPPWHMKFGITRWKREPS